MKSENQRLVLNLVVSSLVFITQLSINFWLSPFIISKLGEDSLGFITLCTNFSEYGTLIAVAVNSMASRFMSYEYNRGNTTEANSLFSSVFWSNVAFSIILAIFSIFLLHKLDKILSIDQSIIYDVKTALFLTLINLIISFISTSYAAVPFVINKMTLNSYTQVISKLLSSLATVILFLNLSPRLYYVNVSALCASFSALVLYILIKKSLLPDFSISIKHFSISKVILLIKSGVWVLLSNLNSILLVGMDLIIANQLIDSKAMGRLSIAKQLPAVIGNVLGTTSTIFAASLTKTYAKENPTTLTERVSFSIKILGGCFSVPFAAIIIYGTYFFKLWLPLDVYDSNAIHQIFILMLLSLIHVIINAFMYSIHSLLIALNKIKWYSVIIFLCSLLSITLTIILTKKTFLGLYAIAGTSTVILGLVNLIIIPLYAEKAARVPHFTYLRPIFKNYYVFGVILAIFLLVKPILLLNSWFTFLVSMIIISAIGYIIVFMLLLKKAERKKVFQFAYSLIWRKQN